MGTQYYVASSLDGFIADTHHSLDWLFQFGEVTGSSYSQFLLDVGAIAVGATTYEWILKHQIYADSERPQAWSYEQPTWVFTSRTLPKIEGANIQFVKGDVRPVHQQMAEIAAEKNIWIVGGGDLAGQFYDRGLLDEIIVFVASTTLGSGAPLLPRRTQPPLELRSATLHGTAFVELHYDVLRSKTPDNYSSSLT